MRTFDLSPLYRSTVGFDRLFNMLDAAPGVDNSPSYPPYNIERLGEDDYRITLAVAGFAPEDLELEVEENVLTVKGRKSVPTQGERTFLHQGIAERSFERRFHLADHVIVKGAGMENGLLNVELQREIPEAKRPRRIEIAASDGAEKAKTLEDKAA